MSFFFLSLGSWWFSPIHWDTTNLKSTLKTIIRMGGKTLVSFWSNIAGVHGCYSANSIQFPWVLVCQQVLIHPQIWFRCPWFGFVYVYLNIGLPHSTGWSLYPLFSCHVGRGAPYFRHAQIPCCLRCVCMSIYIYIFTFVHIYIYISVHMSAIKSKSSRANPQLLVKHQVHPVPPSMVSSPFVDGELPRSPPVS